MGEHAAWSLLELRPGCISKVNVCGDRPTATGAAIGDILKDRRMGVAPHSDNQRSVLRLGTDVGPAIVREAPDLEGTRRTDQVVGI